MSLYDYMQKKFKSLLLYSLDKKAKLCFTMNKDHIASALIALLSTSGLKNEETTLDDEKPYLLHCASLF